MKSVLDWASVCAIIFSCLGCEEGGGTSASAPVVPPPNAVYLEPGTEPEFVMHHAIAASRGQNGNVASEFIGQWVPAEGWAGVAEVVNLQHGATTIGMYYSTAGMIGGGYWVLAVVPTKDSGVQKGDQIVVQGKISEIQIRMAGPTPTYRIILDPTRILEKPNH